MYNNEAHIIHFSALFSLFLFFLLFFLFFRCFFPLDNFLRDTTIHDRTIKILTWFSYASSKSGDQIILLVTPENNSLKLKEKRSIDIIDLQKSILLSL